MSSKSGNTRVETGTISKEMSVQEGGKHEKVIQSDFALITPGINKFGELALAGFPDSVL